MTKILKYLKSVKIFVLFSSLAQDSRTLLKTPKSCNIVFDSPKHYSHLGLKIAIDFKINNCADTPTAKKFGIIIDGVPISRSSQNSFWLSLACSVRNQHTTFFVVGVYQGSHKPASFNQLYCGCGRVYAGGYIYQ